MFITYFSIVHKKSSFLFLWSVKYSPSTVGETEAQKMIDPLLVVTAPGVLHLSTRLSHGALCKDAERWEEWPKAWGFG